MIARHPDSETHFFESPVNRIQHDHSGWHRCPACHATQTKMIRDLRRWDAARQARRGSTPVSITFTIRIVMQEDAA